MSTIVTEKLIAPADFGLNQGGLESIHDQLWPDAQLSEQELPTQSTQSRLFSVPPGYKVSHSGGHVLDPARQLVRQRSSLRQSPFLAQSLATLQQVCLTQVLQPGAL
jgi:hypothetical protein